MCLTPADAGYRAPWAVASVLQLLEKDDLHEMGSQAGMSSCQGQACPHASSKHVPILTLTLTLTLMPAASMSPCRIRSQRVLAMAFYVRYILPHVDTAEWTDNSVYHFEAAALALS